MIRSTTNANLQRRRCLDDKPLMDLSRARSHLDENGEDSKHFGKEQVRRMRVRGEEDSGGMVNIGYTVGSNLQTLSVVQFESKEERSQRFRLGCC